MQPSSDQPTDPGGGGNALRRFGPIVAIVAVIAVVAALVLTGGGDDDADDQATTDTTAGDDTPAERPAGAISWTQAQDEGLDVEFPDTCDPETGRVAIPYFYAPECFADVDDNGGATHTGVTADSITVVYYSAPEDDPVLDFITWDEIGLVNDWSGIDDMTEWWWDADATGPDEIQREGTGMVRFVDGGTRYLPGAWTDEVRAFDEEGSIIVYGEPPASETPPDYPSPAGG